MIEQISNRIATSFVKNDVIPEEDQPVYQYGIELLVSNFISIVLIMTCGLILGRGLEAVVFLLCFIPVRLYSGGYHAKTYFRCDMTFLFIFLGCTLVYQFFLYYPVFPVLLLTNIAAILITIKYAPIENPGKPLTDEQKKQYKIVSISIIGFLSLLSIALWILGIAISMLIELTIFIVAILMIVEKKLRRKTK